MSEPAPQRPLTDLVRVSDVFEADGLYCAEVEVVTTEGWTLPLRIELAHAEHLGSEDVEVTESARARVTRAQDIVRLKLEEGLVRMRAEVSA